MLLLGLVLLVGGVGLGRYGAQRRRRALVKWASPDALAATGWSGRHVLREMAFAAAVGLLLMAAARPQGAVRAAGEGPCGAVVLLMDGSASMRATDVQPSRQGVATQWARRLVEQLPACRIGLAGFADEAQVLCPPTTDHRVLLDLLADLPTDVLSGHGTAVHEALTLGRHVVARSGGGVLVLISDGEFHEVTAGPPAPGTPARDLITVAVGGMLPVPVPGHASGSTVTDPRTSLPALTTARPDALADLARAGGGLAVDATPVDPGVRRAAEFCGQRLAQLSPTASSLERAELYPWALVPAVLLLILHVSMAGAPRASPGERNCRRPASGLGLLILMLLPAASCVPADREATHDGVAAARGDDRPRQLYNRSLALHEAERTDEAQRLYVETLSLPGCPAPVRARCLNNLAELALRETRALAGHNPDLASRALARARASLTEARRLDPTLAAVAANLQDATALATAIEVRQLLAQSERTPANGRPEGLSPPPGMPVEPRTERVTTATAAGPSLPRSAATPARPPSDVAATLERLCESAGSTPDLLRLMARRQAKGSRSAGLPW